MKAGTSESSGIVRIVTCLAPDNSKRSLTTYLPGHPGRFLGNLTLHIICQFEKNRPYCPFCVISYRLEIIDEKRGMGR